MNNSNQQNNSKAKQNSKQQQPAEQPDTSKTLAELTTTEGKSICKSGFHGPFMTVEAERGHKEIKSFENLTVTHAIFDGFGDSVRQVAWFGDNVNYYDHAVAIGDAGELDVLATIYTEVSLIEEFVDQCMSSRQGRVHLSATIGGKSLAERIDKIGKKRNYSSSIIRYYSDIFRLIADDLGILMPDPSYFTVSRYPRMLASEQLIKNELIRSEIAAVLPLPELPMTTLRAMKNAIDKNSVAIDVLVAVIRNIFLRMHDIMRFVSINRSKDFRQTLWYVRATVDRKWYGKYHESLSEEILKSEQVQALSRILNMVKIALAMGADAVPRGSYEDHRHSIDRIHRHINSSHRLKLVAVDDSIASQISHTRIEDTRRNVIGVFIDRAVAPSGRVSGIRTMPSPDIDSRLTGEMNRFVISYDLHDKVSPLGAAIQSAFVPEEDKDGIMFLVRDALIYERNIALRGDGVKAGEFKPVAIMRNMLIDFDQSKVTENVAHAAIDEMLTLYLLSMQAKLGSTILRAGVASTSATGPRFIAFEILAERGRYTPRSQSIVGDYFKVASPTEALLMLPDNGATSKALVGDDHVGEQWFNRQIRIRPDELTDIYASPAYLRTPLGTFTYQLQVERAFLRDLSRAADGSVHNINVTKSIPVLLGVEDDMHPKWDYIGVGYYGLMAARSCVDSWMRLYSEPAWANPRSGGETDNVALNQMNRTAAQLARILGAFMNNSTCVEVAARMASLIKYEQETDIMLDYETVTGASEFMGQLKLQAAVCMMMYCGVFGDAADDARTKATALINAISSSDAWNHLIHGEKRMN